jgi:outer membrane protein OmpA-like peptidoglycan-associated protein
MMPAQRLRTVVCMLSLAGAAALVGCRSPEPESPSAGLTSATPPRSPDLGRGAPRVTMEGAYNMYVAEPVRKVCSGAVPFFEFDSSDTREGDQPTMKTLAECMSSGPLSGKTIKLIGRTDPRGTTAYNDKLGLERAEQVKRYLVSHGVESTRVQVESVGEEAASPAPKDWPKDRRVEIQLVP